jgi:hypothetical protein
MQKASLQRPFLFGYQPVHAGRVDCRGTITRIRPLGLAIALRFGAVAPSGPYRLEFSARSASTYRNSASMNASLG